MHMIYMYLYKRYVGDPDICICYIAPVQNPVPPHLAFASARLMALRRLVAGRALDFEEESCMLGQLDLECLVCDMRQIFR